MKKLTGNQSKLDLNKNSKLDSQDFKMLRDKKMAKGGAMNETFPENDAMSYAGGGGVDDINGETIISKVGNRNEIKKYIKKDLGIKDGSKLDGYIYFDDDALVFIDKTVCKWAGRQSNPNLKLKEVSKMMKKAILNAGYKISNEMAQGGSTSGWCYSIGGL